MAIDFLKSLDWGSVPAYFGGISLLLALRIFKRDRDRLDREQVDEVGVWALASVDTTRSTPTARVTWHIKNASRTPVQVVRIEYKVYSEWIISAEYAKDLGGVADGKEYKRGIISIGTVPPEVEKLALALHFVDDQSPAPDSVLDGPQPVWAEVEHVLLVDNAGRRWIQRPRKGRSRQVHWFSLLSERQKNPFHPWSRPVDNFIGYWRATGIRGLRLETFRRRAWRTNPSFGRPPV